MKKILPSNIKIISRDSKYFPKNLCILDDCPDILFAIGNEKLLNNFSISIVGTRSSSIHGNELAKEYSSALANTGITIVSGMASGIDTAAHEGAVSSNEPSTGSTIAIVACGFNYLYTKKNIPLIEKILANNGVIISEYFPDTPPQTFTFLRRNRLIATISEATIVVEAPSKSGALSTAKIASNNNKPVFAIPWNVTLSKGKGCNLLIQNGARLLTNYEEILSFFNITHKKISISKPTNYIQSTKNADNIPDSFKSIYYYISKNSPLTKESIYSYFKDESISTLNSKLILMELQNLIVYDR